MKGLGRMGRGDPLVVVLTDQTLRSQELVLAMASSWALLGRSLCEREARSNWGRFCRRSPK